MDSSERPNPHPHRTSELFICFTSRLSSSSSSSSMKISSKSSILSPARGRDGGPISLSASLSHRLKTNGSLKGGQSPMFPTGGKKRGVAFENPEPSSPKVTCIGQVRVKTKKQGKKIRTLSRKRRGEVSFRRGESGNHQHQQQQESRNQRWVHLPLTICEAVKSCGAEFSCLFPCFSSTGERGKEERGSGSSERRSGHGGSEDSSCGAVFARWFVALNDGEEEVGKGRRREVELVVGGEEEEVGERGGVTRERSLRRHVFEEIEIEDGKCEVKGGEEEEEEEGRVSICIPPKNALLLMRCRSDPIRASALANRFWESPGVPRCEEEDDDDDNKEVEDEEEIGVEDVEKSGGLKGDFRLTEDEEVEESEKILLIEANGEEEEEEKLEGEAEVVMEVEEEEYQEEEEKLEINDELQQEVEEEENPEQEVNQEVAAEENESNNSPSEAVVVDPEKSEIEDDVLLLTQEMGEEQMEERRASHHSEVSLHLDSPEEELEVEEALVAEQATLEEEEEEEEEKKSTEEKDTLLKEDEGEEEEIVTQERPESEQTQIEGSSLKSEEREERQTKVERESSPVLPDCLLLMRCEPKLSMEVSKETWVCSTDFIRWLPERKAKKTDGGDEPKKRRSTDSNPAPTAAHHYQPPRSSCSLPAAVAGVSMATMIEQKLVNAVPYEPLVLTRCKSEPMRTAAAKLKPESCFWKNRKLEPHRRATVGVGAAGVGF